MGCVVCANRLILNMSVKKMRLKNLVFAVLILIFNLAVNSKIFAAMIELQIPCEIGGVVKAVMPKGEIIELGQVEKVPVKTNWPAYTASKWADNSSVSATAVNAIHILINVENNRGRIISIVPSVTVAPAAEAGAYFSLNMPAGNGIFGGFAPLTGSKATVRNKNNGEERILDEQILNSDDILIIRSEFYDDVKNNLYMLEIENRPAGRVIAYKNSGCEIIARVIHPVGGVGRFGGSIYQHNSRIRASHCGVICITTSKMNEVGGFQIIPLTHALTSSEMSSAWDLTQWLIISPLPERENIMLEGHEPLFKKAFIPGVQASDLKKFPDIINAYNLRPLVLCRISGGNWQKLPVVSGKEDNALKNITHLRIYYPIFEGLF